MWEAEDETTADWRTFRLQSELHRVMDVSDGRDKSQEPPPLHAPIHQALHWLRQNFSKMKKCANHDCSRPFFITDGKRQFCSSFVCCCRAKGTQEEVVGRTRRSVA